LRRSLRMRNHYIIAVVYFLCASTLVRADVEAPIGPPVKVAMTEEGPIFTTDAGMTLYTYSGDDGTPGKSQCSHEVHADFPDPTAGFGKIPLPTAALHKACVQKWPPLRANENARTGDDWTTIDRPDGGKQWAYRGRPLYTSVKDHKPGDINGALVVGQVRGWRLASAPLNLPPGLKLVRRAEGLVLATQNDRPVYTPVAARAQKICDRCEERYKPIAASAIAKVSGEWSIVAAGAGRSQYVFNGKTLFAAPAGLSNADIAADGWDTVIYRKAAATPNEIRSQFSLIGEIYTDSGGRTLYVFACTTPVRDGVGCDDPGDAAAYWSALCGEAKDCARRWRPYAATANARDVGDWSVVDVADPMFIEATGATYPAGTPRVKAWAYRGRPVYTYFQDKEPGDIWGQSLRWFSFSGFYALQIPGRGLLD
jgi:predicted lipoprotein with Yx(FWY)xxD motif